MTTREEMIERAQIYLHSLGSVSTSSDAESERTADFALSVERAAFERAAEMARASSKEWESMSHDAQDALRFLADSFSFAAQSRPEQNQPGAGPSLAGSAVTQREASAPPAVLADADVLERAAEILASAYWSEMKVAQPAAVCKHVAQELRARAAPPEPTDVFEAFAREWVGTHNDPVHASDRRKLAALLRERFSPLVEALENIQHSDDPYSVGVANHALAALRMLEPEQKTDITNKDNI